MNSPIQAHAGTRTSALLTSLFELSLLSCSSWLRNETLSVFSVKTVTLYDRRFYAPLPDSALELSYMGCQNFHTPTEATALHIAKVIQFDFKNQYTENIS